MACVSFALARQLGPPSSLPSPSSLTHTPTPPRCRSLSAAGLANAQKNFNLAGRYADWVRRQRRKKELVDEHMALAALSAHTQCNVDDGKRRPGGDLSSDRSDRDGYESDHDGEEVQSKVSFAIEDLAAMFVPHRVRKLRRNSSHN